MFVFCNSLVGVRSASFLTLRTLLRRLFCAAYCDINNIRNSNHKHTLGEERVLQPWLYTYNNHFTRRVVANAYETCRLSEIETERHIDLPEATVQMRDGGDWES